MRADEHLDHKPIFEDGQEPQRLNVEILEPINHNILPNERDAFSLLMQESAFIFGNFAGGNIGEGDPFSSLPAEDKLIFRKRFMALCQAMHELGCDIRLSRWG